MDENVHEKASMAASKFVMMLFQHYFSSEDTPVSEDLKTGLLENGTETMAFELIQDLAEQKGELSTTVKKMAQSHPQTCIALGEIFASALLKGAGRGGPAYEAITVSLDMRDEEISQFYAEIKAPTLSRFFEPMTEVLH